MPPDFFFNSPHVLALTSNGAVNFAPADFDVPLTGSQSAYLKEACGVDIPRVFWRRQVHGDVIMTAQGGPESVKGCPDADAYITAEKHLPIAIRTADCVPVLIFDPLTPAIGLAHAGWKGTQRRIAAKTVEKMCAAFGSRPVSLKAVLGPSIRPCCYQVGEEFRQHFPKDVVERQGSLYADMPGANRRQLEEAGLKPGNIVDGGICTCCNKKYFSFRRDADKAGRMITLMMLL